MMAELVKKFKIYHQKKKDLESNRLKKEMCQNAIKSGICPNFCHHCAWNTTVFKND